jgi:hypothetical protein
MINFHAVMQGEDGMEFGASTTANTREEAYEQIMENYPESRIVQLESPADTQDREARTYDLIRRGADFDEDGRPFFPHGDEDADYDEDDDDWE